jgi:cytoskeletal protein CcmA (bactofilin family)
MRLQGKFEGKISTPGRLHVTREAHLQADVESGSIIVEGEVQGNLTASDRIDLKQTARYEGDLKASKLVVEEGAVFSGHVSVGPNAVGSKPPTSSATAPARPPGAPPLPHAQPVK